MGGVCPFLVLSAKHQCLTRKNSKLPEGCLIHSDQGSHYTSSEFQKLLKEKKIEQSMSRR